jgi:hypothetical protein
MTLAGRGLSKYYQSILSRTNERQRFVTGKYPVIVTIEENPTRKWLNLGKQRDSTATSTSEIFVNGTSIVRSLASYSRFQWLDDDEREELHDRYHTLSLELLAEIHIQLPGYVNILPADGAGSSTVALRDPDTQLFARWQRNRALRGKLEDYEWTSRYRDRLWVTGFTLASRKGFVKSVDITNGNVDSVNKRSESMTLWPNEVSSVPSQLLETMKSSTSNEFEDALLVSDGFLVPGKDNGGIYIVKNPGNPNSEWTACLTDLERSDRWFYHR